jgi:hypothetical protein
MSKSYDISSKFSSNQKAMIKDQFDYSPAQKEHYNFKDCVVGGIHVGGMGEEKSMYSKMERSGQKKMARMEQDRELD